MGAFTNEGLFWINKKGEIIPVNIPPYQMYSSHEEYAYEKWGISLEDALRRGYIRVQAIKNQYLYIDHRLKEVRSAQVPSLESFFYENDSPVIYDHYVIERQNSDMKEFSRGQAKAAFNFAVDGTVPDEETDLFNKALNQQARQKEIEAQHPYYQRQTALGDWFKPMSFHTWLENREQK